MDSRLNHTHSCGDDSLSCEAGLSRQASLVWLANRSGFTGKRKDETSNEMDQRVKSCLQDKCKELWQWLSYEICLFIVQRRVEMISFRRCCYRQNRILIITKDEADHCQQYPVKCGCVGKFVFRIETYMHFFALRWPKRPTVRKD